MSNHQKSSLLALGDWRCWLTGAVALIGCMASLPARADLVFGKEELAAVAPLLDSSRCQSRCETRDWMLERRAAPRGAAHLLTAGDAVFLVRGKFPNYCGAAQCAEAYVLRDAERLSVLRSGYDISASNPLNAKDIPPLEARQALPGLARSPAKAAGSGGVRPLANSVSSPAQASLTGNQNVGNATQANTPNAISDASCHTLSSACGAPASTTICPDLNPSKRAMVEELLRSYGGNRQDIGLVAQYADHALLAWGAYEELDVLGMLTERGWQPLRAEWGETEGIVGEVHATLFVSRSGQHVLAFRGTMTGGDVVTDLTVLPSDQVAEAARMALRIRDEFPDVIFVGHSMGGRFAQLARVLTGNSAVIFNAAPAGLPDSVIRSIVGPSAPAFGSVLIHFSHPRDAVSSIDPARSIVVTNAVSSDFQLPLESSFFGPLLRAALSVGASYITQRDVHHNMGMLALAMQLVGIAHGEGWFDAFDCYERQRFAMAAATPPMPLENAAIGANANTSSLVAEPRPPPGVGATPDTEGSPTLLGRTVSVALYAPTRSNQATHRYTANVSNQIEFMSGTVESLRSYGAKMIGAHMDIGSNFIDIRFTESLRFAQGEFNGPVFYFAPNGQSIVGASLDPESSYGPNEVVISYDNHSVSVNYQAPRSVVNSRVLVRVHLGVLSPVHSLQPLAASDQTRLQQYIGRLNLPDAAGRSLISSGVEALMASLLSEQSINALVRLGLSRGVVEANVLQAMENTIGGLSPTGLSTDVVRIAIIDSVAGALEQAVFSRAPASTLPASWQAPLRALVRASFAEGAGLAFALGNPSPTAWVAPVVDRVYDAVEIHRGITGLRQDREVFLYSVALGAEVNAELITRYPGARSQSVLDQWRSDTRVNLSAMVGPGAVEAVSQVIEMGQAALIAQRLGNTAEVVGQVLQLQHLADQRNLPTLRGTRSPRDLLLNLVNAGDAASTMASVFLAGNPLRTVGQESILPLPSETNSYGVNAIVAVRCDIVRECNFFREVYSGDRNLRDSISLIFRSVQLTQPIWVSNGVSSSMIPVIFNNEMYLLGSVCKPHFCSTNRLTVLYSPLRKFAAGSLISEGEGRRILGNEATQFAQIFADYEQEDSYIGRAVRTQGGALPLPLSNVSIEPILQERSRSEAPRTDDELNALNPVVVPFLSFPLRCWNAEASIDCEGNGYQDGPYTVASPDAVNPGILNSVLDHQMERPYNSDGYVVAYTGERRESGHPKKTGSYPLASGVALSVNDLYRGDDESSFRKGLNYDGHPGYDFYAEFGAFVYAASDGVVVSHDGDRCIPKGISEGCRAWGFIGIDHGNGYITQYGHLSAVFKNPGDPVKQGEEIGLVGTTSPPKYSLGAHLHFEVLKSGSCGMGYCVVDPYGWEGEPGADPLKRVTGVKNIRLWKRP